MLVKLDTQLWKQHFQIGDIIRQFWTVEPWSISNPGARGERMQFDMTGGVAPPLQAT
tara:strand:+ start:291 stop:461 length:171 start_codon:yes stop_codon:yes gene_type:complete